MRDIVFYHKGLSLTLNFLTFASGTLFYLFILSYSYVFRLQVRNYTPAPSINNSIKVSDLPRYFSIFNYSIRRYSSINDLVYMCKFRAIESQWVDMVVFNLQHVKLRKFS